jgi:cytochrome P450
MKGSLLRFYSDPIRSLHRMRPLGNVVAFSRGSTAVVAAFGPENNRALLADTKRFYNFAKAPFSIPKDCGLARLTSGLVAMSGERHRVQRRLMMPAFTKQAIAAHRDAMVEVASRRIARWRAGDVVDARAEMVELTLLVAMRCLFGLDVEGEARALGAMTSRAMDGLVNPWNILFPVPLPGTPLRRYLDDSDRTEQRMRGLIQDARAREGGTDVLALLCRAQDEDGASLTEQELIGHTMTVFVASHETTAFTLAWTLFLLAENPGVLHALREELSGALRGEAPTVEQLDALPLLDAVLRESMRLLPATPVLFLRVAQEATVLGAHALGPGTHVALSPLMTHREPSLYPEPLSFRPSRWDDASVGPYDYLPFGAGPRLCLGAGFANQALRMVLPLILQRFEPELLPNARIDPKVRGITMGPANELPIRLRAIGSTARTVLAGGRIRELVAAPQ